MPKTHGYRGTPTYASWINMRRRCYDSSRKDYPRYGGRGIQVCTEWQNSFLAFLCDMGERPHGMTIDRINSNGDYHKENCRWITPKGQSRNTCINRDLTYKGKTKCLAEWADQYGLLQVTLTKRLNEGWPIEKALKTPLNATRKGVAHNRKKITYRGKTKDIKSWARHFGINYATLHKRISTYGMSFEEAVTKPVRKNVKRKLR